MHNAGKFHLLYIYNFSRDVIFTDDRNPRYLRIICYQPLSSICIVITLKFEGLIFVDNKLPTKTAKITSHKNFYVYGIIIW